MSSEDLSKEDCLEYLEEEYLSNEEILNIILNEDPLDIKCDYELVINMGKCNSLIIDIKCIFNFEKEIEIYYNYELPISIEEINETEDGKTVESLNKGKISINIDNCPSFSFKSLGYKINNQLKRRFYSIMVKEYNPPSKEDCLEYLDLSK